MQQKFLMLVKGKAVLHRVVQGPRVVELRCPYPGHHHPACSPGKAEGRLFCASVLEVAYVTVSVGLDEGARPRLTSREAGDAVQLCAQEEREVGLEDSQSSLPHPGAPDPSQSRLTMSFDLIESCVSFCAG